mgnify:CR=1 FL=1
MESKLAVAAITALLLFWGIYKLHQRWLHDKRDKNIVELSLVATTGLNGILSLEKEILETIHDLQDACFNLENPFNKLLKDGGDQRYSLQDFTNNIDTDVTNLKQIFSNLDKLRGEIESPDKANLESITTIKKLEIRILSILTRAKSVVTQAASNVKYYEEIIDIINRRNKTIDDESIIILPPKP